MTEGMEGYRRREGFWNDGDEEEWKGRQEDDKWGVEEGEGDETRGKEGDLGYNIIIIFYDCCMTYSS